MRGYCALPSIITSVQNGVIEIEFYGDHTTPKASINHFYKFVDSDQMILANLRGRKTPLYAKAIREAEIALGIDEEHSIINRINI